MSADNWVQLLVPIIGIVVAAVSAGLSYIFAKKQQIRADERRLKEEGYLEYIAAISNNVLSDDIESSRSRLSDAHNHILLIGSSDVINKLRKFTYYISPDNEGDFHQQVHNELITELIKSMRYDLTNKKNINKGYPIIGVSGKRKR